MTASTPPTEQNKRRNGAHPSTSRFLPNTPRDRAYLKGIGVFCTLLSLLGASELVAQELDSVRRFAIIVGANDGGAERTTLRYATSDARAFDRVVRKLGGVDISDRSLLLNPRRSELMAAVDQMREHIRKVQKTEQVKRTELIVYYSGHSDERGLLLFNDRLSYTDLRATLKTLPADVRIAVLDSCSSGALTRTKGGKRRPSFLHDASVKIQGHAYLTSAAEDEAAQESDSIHASFFTYFFLAGLRGAADVTGDGKVTLTEAYRFTFDETLARTESTLSGPQHPAFDIQLIGSGDLVLTDLRRASASLNISKSLQGRVFIRDESGRLILELFKARGRPIALSLEPGVYNVTLEEPRSKRRASLTLQDGGSSSLHTADFTLLPLEPTASRGTLPPSHSEDDFFTHAPFNISLLSGLSFLDLQGQPATESTTNFSLNLLMGRSARVDGFEIAGLANWQTDGVRGIQLAGGINHSEGDAFGLRFAGAGNTTLGSAQGIQIAGLGNYAGASSKNVSIALIFNATKGTHRGAQISPHINLADDVVGMQFGGVVNLADNVTGFQLGMVNIADDVDGLQLGLVNIADHVDGLPLGLVNIIDDGIQDFSVWTSDITNLNMGFKLGNTSLYTMITLGADVAPSFSTSLQDATQRTEQGEELGWWSLGVALGGRISLSKRFSLDLDLITGTLQPAYILDLEHIRMHNQLRAGVRYTLHENFTLVAGPIAHMLVSNGPINPFVHERTQDRLFTATRSGIFAGVDF